MSLAPIRHSEGRSVRRGRSSGELVWIGAVDDEPGRAPRPWKMVAMAGLGLFVLFQIAAFSRLLLFFGLACWLLATLLGLSARRHSNARRGDERRGLLIEAGQVYLATGPGGARRRLVASLEHPFGLTLLCNPMRTRLVLSITTKERTLHVGANVSTEERRARSRFLGRASTVADDDPILAAIAPDGRALDLSLGQLTKLYRILSRRDQRAPGRCFLSDTRGAGVVLDGNELFIGCQRFDLGAPLEWRALWFQERLSGATTGANDRDPGAMTAGSSALYQATWLRQGKEEAVFVSLAPPPMLAKSVPAEDGSELARAHLRDRRLMAAKRDAPPPRELRIGIERTYMLPLRAALARANAEKR